CGQSPRLSAALWPPPDGAHPLYAAARRPLGALWHASPASPSALWRPPRPARALRPRAGAHQRAHACARPSPLRRVAAAPHEHGSLELPLAQSWKGAAPPGRARRGFRPRFLDRLRGRPRAKRPALLLLDQDGLRPTMAKALAHMAGLDGAAHIKGHLAAASSFAFGLVRLTHSSFVSTSLGFLNAAPPLR